ncbi:hypothetical protein TELCIR_13471, partial [Teladorsagia circumcincta]
GVRKTVVYKPTMCASMITLPTHASDHHKNLRIQKQWKGVLNVVAENGTTMEGEMYHKAERIVFNIGKLTIDQFNDMKKPISSTQSVSQKGNVKFSERIFVDEKSITVDRNTIIDAKGGLIWEQAEPIYIEEKRSYDSKRNNPDGSLFWIGGAPLREDVTQQSDVSGRSPIQPLSTSNKEVDVKTPYIWQDSLLDKTPAGSYESDQCPVATAQSVKTPSKKEDSQAYGGVSTVKTVSEHVTTAQSVKTLSKKEDSQTYRGVSTPKTVSELVTTAQSVKTPSKKEDSRAYRGVSTPKSVSEHVTTAQSVKTPSKKEESQAYGGVSTTKTVTETVVTKVTTTTTENECRTGSEPTPRPREHEKQLSMRSEAEQKESVQQRMETPVENAELITDEPEKPKPVPMDPLAEPLLPAREPDESEVKKPPMEVDGTQPGSVEQLKVDTTPASSKESDAPPAEVQKMTTESQSVYTAKMETGEEATSSTDTKPPSIGLRKVTTGSQPQCTQKMERDEKVKTTTETRTSSAEMRKVTRDSQSQYTKKTERDEKVKTATETKTPPAEMRKVTTESQSVYTAKMETGEEATSSTDTKPPSTGLRKVTTVSQPQCTQKLERDEKVRTATETRTSSAEMRKVTTDSQSQYTKKTERDEKVQRATETRTPSAEMRKVTTDSQSQYMQKTEKDKKVKISTEQDLIAQQRCREESGLTATKDSHKSEQSSKTKLPIRTQIVTVRVISLYARER